MAIWDTTPSVQADKSQIISQWFQDYYLPLFRYLTRLVQDQELAADILQDTFTKALTSFDIRQPPDNPSAWLYRIATNRAYDLLRRKRRWQWMRITEDHPLPAHEPHHATAQAIRSCLAQLKRREAEALVLNMYVGLTCAEIAQLTNEAEATVRVRIRRARERFRVLYDKEVA